MNRFPDGRRASTGSPQIRLDRVTAAGDDTLDLLFRSRVGSDEVNQLERMSLGEVKFGKSGMEDLLDAEIGKNDYDWLLTPPQTPLHTSCIAKESAKETPLSSAPRSRTTSRSVSNTRPSRLSTSQSENGPSATRPVRSSSVTRPSISNNHSSSSFNNNNKASMLNTSMTSVTSSRPLTPGNRPVSERPSPSSTTARTLTTTTTGRPSISSTAAKSSTTSRPVASRMPTPTRTRPTPVTSADKTTRPSNNSRPSTPTSCRPQTPSNPKSVPNSRPNSRSSTPVRRPTTPGSAAPSAGSRNPSVGRVPAVNSRPTSRPSSPSPRPRAPIRPVDLPDFPNDAPPNLRTKADERPASAGRTRPGMTLTLRASPNSEASVPAAAAAGPASSNRRNYLPVVSRSKFPENSPKGTQKLNVHDVASEIQKLAGSDGGLKKPSKPVSATDSTGFGRTISKSSLDMALRHMDIRQGMGGIRASSLFPQSIRSTTPRRQSSRKSEPVVPLASDELSVENGSSCNGTFSPMYNGAATDNGESTITKSPDTASADVDIDGSSRYDAFLLKEEDSNNMSWLHSVDDKSDQSPVFDHRFEPLPEPFGLL